MSKSTEAALATISGSVEQALADLADAQIDLAVVDVNLAGTQSFPIADALRERGVPFLFTKLLLLTFHAQLHFMDVGLSHTLVGHCIHSDCCASLHQAMV